MEVFRLGFVLLIIGGTGAQVLLEPSNVAVLRGSQARFNCSTVQPMGSMTWLLNGRLVLIIQANVSSIFPRFTAKNFTTPGTDKWEFTISDVQRDDTGSVTCQVMGGTANVASLSVQERGSVEIIAGNRTVTQGAQTEFQCRAVGWFPEPNISWSVNGVESTCNRSSEVQGTPPSQLFNSNCTLTITATKNSSVQCLVTVSALSTPQISTVFLTVEPAKKTRDQTVLIATVVSFSAAALLALLIILIVFCCKRRKKKKSKYQEEVRRAQMQTQSRTYNTEYGNGRVNQAYTGRVEDGNRGIWHTNYSGNQVPYSMDDIYDDGLRKHRHATIL